LHAPTVHNDFATRLYDKLAGTRPGDNLFLSPFSIDVALAMCAVGARGETRRVMVNLLGAPPGVDEQNRRYADLLKSVNGDGNRPFQLVTANALWGQHGYHFKSDFQEAIADFYDGALHVVNFRAKPDEAVATINAWVNDMTRQKIKDLLKRGMIDDDTRLVLTNAIYFKGQWDKEFDVEATENENWHGSSGTSKVPVMHQRGDYSYYEADDFQALDLPYRGRQLSMLIVLPRQKDSLASLERRWAAEFLYGQVTRNMHHEKAVILALPRFKMDSELMLKPALCELGAAPAFSPEADFSGIGDEALAISEVIHKAFVEVNEEGTEAAAATAVVMRAAGAVMPTRDPKVFKADHPFLFFIRDTNTSAVLFSGRVHDPA
jgi:serpin B